MKDHLIKKKTWHLKDADKEDIICCYCGSELDKLKSEHHLHFHYKGTVCKVCGKKIWAKVNFSGCGADEIPHSELEKRIA